ncbi:uncharacterized protein [Nothobranchius furzeri]|uniref:Transcript variant X1 n=1 Tax=Nothobranchius furzeri TaxID=105023 RepID=A0A9D2YZG9_NOTFU|nr:transcript variant X1 [Nothobranchius furzeri]
MIQLHKVKQFGLLWDFDPEALPCDLKSRLIHSRPRPRLDAGPYVPSDIPAEMTLTDFISDPWMIALACVGLIIGLLLCTKSNKKERQPLRKRDDRLQTYESVLKTMKREWDGQLRRKLADVEERKEKNKREVESVEREITQRKTLDIPEELLRQKEELLKAQWRLDDKQRQYEKQLIDIEKMMEPLMPYMTLNTTREVG